MQHTKFQFDGFNSLWIGICRLCLLNRNAMWYAYFHFHLFFSFLFSSIEISWYAKSHCPRYITWRSQCEEYENIGKVKCLYSFCNSSTIFFYEASNYWFFLESYFSFHWKYREKSSRSSIRDLKHAFFKQVTVWKSFFFLSGLSFVKLNVRVFISIERNITLFYSWSIPGENDLQNNNSANIIERHFK